MGLFSSRKPQGIFGNMMPADDWSQIATQPLNDAAPMGQTGQIPNTQAMPKKHEAWRDILGFALGTLGDGIAMNQGRAPMIGPMMMQQKLAQQQQQATMAQKAAERAAQAQAFAGFGLSPQQIAAIQMDGSDKILGSVLDQQKPQYHTNKAGDFLKIGPDGQPQTLYTDNTPDLVPTQSQVFAMDRHTGQQFSAAPSQAGPQPGHVEDGFQFIGGDPSNPQSWKQVGGGVSNGTGGFPRLP